MPATHIEGILVEALIEHFNLLTLPVGVRVAYPNADFIPNGDPYIRLAIVKNNPITHHIGGNREPERLGIFGVNVCWPKGVGLIDPSDLAGQIRDHFKLRTQIDKGPVRIIIVDEPVVQDDMQGPVYDEIPVTISYHVYPDARAVSPVYAPLGSPDFTGTPTTPTPPIDPVDSTQIPNVTYIRAVSRPTLCGYFGVDPTNQAQAITRIQDAARSGKNVFVDPGTYELDPDHALLFDTLPTVFRGAGSGLVTFTSVDFSLTGNLMYVQVGGCGIEGMTLLGEQMFASGTPNTDTLVYVAGGTTPDDFFVARDLHLIGGDKGLALAGMRKVHLSNITCAEQTGHGLSAQINSLSDLTIDGVIVTRCRAEGISISDFANASSATVSEPQARIYLHNYKARDTAQAFDAFLTNTRLLTIDTLFADRCRGGAVELKCKWDDINGIGGSGGTNSNVSEGVQQINLSNIKMRNDGGGTTAGHAIVNLDWGAGTPHGTNPGTVCSRIEMHNLEVSYDDNVTSNSGAVALQGQVDVAIDGLRVSGGGAVMVQLNTPSGSAGIGAMITRLDLNNLVAIGTNVETGLFVQTTAGVDTLTVRNSNIRVSSGSAIRVNTSYVKKMVVEDCVLESMVSGGRPFFIQSSVVELNVNGVHMKPFDYGMWCSTFVSTPALAVLPNVSGCVTSGGLVKVTFAAVHNLVTDDAIYISGVTGTTEANGTWLVTVIDTTAVTLQESAFANAYVSGGTVRRASKLIFDNALIRKSNGSAFRIDHPLYLQAFSCRCNTVTTVGGVNDTSVGTAKIRAQLCRGYLGASPVSTAGSLGDYFLNHTPTAGGASGWMCTTPGTTSTAVWKAMGIAA